MNLRFLTGTAKRRPYLVAAITCCTALPLARAEQSATPTVPESDAAWVRTFAAPYTPPQKGSIGNGASLNWDSRFGALLKSSFHQRQWFWYDHNRLLSTVDLIHTFLGVTGDTILDDNRYVTTAGCVQHLCDATWGMLWIDTASYPPALIFVGNTMVGGGEPTGEHLWLFTSAKLDWQHLPPPFLLTLHRWLEAADWPGDPGVSNRRNLHFDLATIVQPSGIQEDISSATLHLETTSTGAKK